jgi:glycosyltransferase involved in cell wall biosynthesis
LNTDIKISALAITLNEAENIDAFVESLWFADEIIIIDSFSTDNTLDIAAKHKKVRVIQREFDNFSNQKNFAIAQAAHEWLVFFDPDEAISQALANEILEVIPKKNAVAYFVKRQFHFMGKAIKYSGTQSDWIVRVFHKDYNKYNGNLVHEVIETKGAIAKLKNTVPHYSYTDFDSYTAKLHQYSALQAQMLFEKGKRPTLFHFLFRPWYRFWHQYIIRLGFLDGKEGFILTYISAFSVFKRYLNLWLLYRKIN